MKGKQKLYRRDTYGDALQACGNCDPLQNWVLRPLNREKTLSVSGLKTFFHNPYVAPQGNAARTGTGMFYPSFLRIFFQPLPLKRCRAMEVIR